MYKSDESLGLSLRNELHNANFSLSPGALLAFKKCEHSQELRCVNERERKKHIGFWHAIWHSFQYIIQARVWNWKAVGRVMEVCSYCYIQCRAKTVPAACDMRAHPCTHTEVKQKDLGEHWQQYSGRVSKHDRGTTGSSRARQKVRNVVGAGGGAWTMHWNSYRSTSAMLRVDEQEGSRAWCSQEIEREAKKERERNRRVKRVKARLSRGQRHTHWIGEKPAPSVWQEDPWRQRPRLRLFESGQRQPRAWPTDDNWTGQNKTRIEPDRTK